ncbi:MAG: sortase [Anaerolineae bacterium]|nr:sortase [Anaerolineae bacterium]MDQ7035540.1 sortase [Anaerolineae bacterium]
MGRWILIVILGTLVTGCDAFQAAYLDAIEAQLPQADEGRSLIIPTLDIVVDVTTFPLGQQTWDISPWERNAGQLERLGWIDTPSNTVIAAHSEYPSGEPAVFSELDTLRAGDVIFVRDGDLQRRYIVFEVRIVDYRDLTVLYPTTTSRLTLITCSIPSYVAAQNLYYERVAVIAYAVDDD